MDAKRKFADIVELADVWDGLEPSLVEPAASLLMDAAYPGGAAMNARIPEPDPMEATVRSRVLAQIGAAAAGPDRTTEHRPARSAGDLAGPDSHRREPGRLLPERWPERFLKAWQRQPYARMTAAALVVITVTFILSTQVFNPGTASTTAAATKHATTAAGATTAGSTAAATTGATKATTAAATTAAAGTTAATTAAMTSQAATTAGTTSAATYGTSNAGGIVWPLHLIRNLGFDVSQASSVDVRRFRADGTQDRSRLVASRDGLNAIVDLVNQMYLDRPDAATPRKTGILYELVFHLAPQSGYTGTGEPILVIQSTADPNIFMVSGTFTLAPGISAPNGLVQMNAHLTASDLASRLDALLE